MKNIVIATVKSWNLENAKVLENDLKNSFHFTVISHKDDLTYDRLALLNPEYIFFPHWSWIIPETIFSNFNCVVFHMTDLPFGRGGSPLQNLIIRGIYETKISAIRVVNDLDAGDIYLKNDFNVESGSAQEIYKKASNIIYFKMIPFILKNDPIPKKQEGKIIEFKRRKPGQSNLLQSNINDLKKLYDFIRMLDGEGYPKAFFNIENLKIELSQVRFKNGKLAGKFEVTNETE